MQEDLTCRNIAGERETTQSPLSFIWSQKDDSLRNNVDNFMNGIQGSFDDLEYESIFTRNSPLVDDTPTEIASNDLVFNSNPSKCILGVKRKHARRGDIDSNWVPSRRQKKPKGMPKRPLSAYNLFFQSQRVNILQERKTDAGQKVGFKELGQIVGRKWRALSDDNRKTYAKLAEDDKRRYRREIEAYYAMKKTRKVEVTSSLLETPKSRDSYPSNRNCTIEEQLHPKHISSYTHHSQESKRASMLQNAEWENHCVYTKDVDIGIPTNFGAPCVPWSMISSYPPNDLAQVYGKAAPYKEEETSTQTPIAFASLSPSNHQHIQIPGHRSHSDQILLPPGMEVILNQNRIDRAYRVEYKWYSMSRESAQKYIDSLTKFPLPA